MRRALIIVALLMAVTVIAGCAQESAAAQQKETCFANEKVIQTTMTVFKADSGLDAPLKSVLDSTHIACPAGGTYSYDPVAGVASCTVHGHQ